MKKIMNLAAIFAAVAMTIAACSKDETPAGNQGGNNTENGGGNTENTCPDCGQDPCVCEPEYEAPVTIDGNFADWDALTDATVATCIPDHVQSGLNVLKAYADEYYLYVMVEFDFDVITDRAEDNGNPLMLCFSTTHESTFGGYDAWSDCCIEYMTAPHIFTGVDGTYKPYNGDGLYMWTGEAGQPGWSWESVLENTEAEGAGSDNKYELAIMMDVLTTYMEFDGKILLGAMIQQGWGKQGVLPHAEVTEENTAGAAPMMEVPIK